MPTNPSVHQSHDQPSMSCRVKKSAMASTTPNSQRLRSSFKGTTRAQERGTASTYDCAQERGTASTYNCAQERGTASAVGANAFVARVAEIVLLAVGVVHRVAVVHRAARVVAMLQPERMP